MKTRTSTNRLQYLDWLRGIAAITMLQGHVWHSFLRDDLRERGPYVLSQFVGGMPPAVFLFLTGVTFAFLMDSATRKELPPLQRFVTALRRSGYLFALAFAFRLQLWLFALPASWKDLLRVDILNCMGFSMAALAFMALFRTAERIRYCTLAGLAIAFASPLISQIDWSGVPAPLRAYIIPDPAAFGLFPWGAFLAFGMTAGSIIRAIPKDATERFIQWAALAGGALILSNHYFANQPYSIYSQADFWLNSPTQVLIKLGVILLMLSLAFLWTRYAAQDGWSWVRQFGTTSLLVYWVHIELVYGRAFWFLKNSLTELQVLVAAVLVVLLMLALSTAKTYRHRLGPALANLGWSFGPKPDRVPGD